MRGGTETKWRRLRGKRTCTVDEQLRRVGDSGGCVGRDARVGPGVVGAQGVHAKGGHVLAVAAHRHLGVRQRAAVLEPVDGQGKVALADEALDAGAVADVQVPLECERRDLRWDCNTKERHPHPDIPPPQPPPSPHSPTPLNTNSRYVVFSKRRFTMNSNSFYT